MATITGFTSERMLQIENETVVDGTINDAGNLILTRRDGFSIDAGPVSGPKGDPGSGVWGVDVWYQAGNSGTEEPTGEWVSSPPIVHSGQYLWVKTLTTYADPDDPETSFVTTTYTVTKQPESGVDGRGIHAQTTDYQIGVSGTVSPTGDWFPTIPTVPQGDYLWTRTITTYTDGGTNTAYSVAKQGSDGGRGNDGDTTYLHVAYAQSADGAIGFSTSDPSGRSYMGTATSTESADPTDPEDYKWSLILGPAGVGISSSVVTYQESESGTVTPTGSWNASVPTITEGNFLWTRTIFNFTDGASKTTYSVAKQGKNGLPGSDGRGILSIVEEYYLSDSSTTYTGGTWSDTRPAWVAGKFYWTRSVITFTTGSPTTTTPICVSGSSGSSGRSVTNVDVEYYLSTSSTVLAGGNWSTTAPVWVDGEYMWTKTITTYSTGSPTESSPVCITGGQGPKGSDGNDGVGVDETVVSYQASAGNTAVPTGTWSSTIPIVTPGEYLWTRSVTTYTNSSTSTSYSVARQGTDGTPGLGVVSNTTYYQMAGSFPTAPAPNTVPAEPWSLVEPTYTGGPVSLYTVIRTLMSDGTSKYGPVVLSAAFSAAKDAKTIAQEAQTLAGNAQDDADQAIADALAAANAASAADGKATAAQTDAEQAIADALAAADQAASKGRVWAQDVAPPAGRTFEWAGTANASESVEKLDGVEVRRNLFTDPAPGSSAGFTSTFGAVIGYNTSERSVTVLTDGTYQSGVYVRAAGVGELDVPYSAGVWVKAPAGAQMYAHLRVFGNVPGSVILYFEGTGVWSWVALEGAEASTASGSFTELSVRSASDAVFQFEVRRLILEVGATCSGFFDGNTPDDRAYDLWINTTNGGNTPNRWVNGAWEVVTDKAAASKGRMWAQDLVPPAGRSFEWVGSVDASESVEKLDGVEVRRNFVPNPAASGTNWQASSTATTTQTYITDPRFPQGRALESVQTSAASSGWVDIGLGSQASNFSEGETVFVSVRFEGIGIERVPHLGMAGGAGATSFSVIERGHIDHGDGTFTLTLLATLGEITSAIRFIITNLGDRPEGSIIRAGGSLLVKSDVPVSYFDGSTPSDRAYDLWINTTDGKNTPNRWVNGGWEIVTDKAATDAAAAALLAQTTANTARTEATNKAAAAESAAKTHADAQAEAARLAAIATASGDATAKANAAKAAAEVTAAADALTKANAAQAAAEAKAATAQAAAVAAQNTANAKGKVIIQNAAPAAADRLAQNLWIDTTGGANTPKRWVSGTTWAVVTDKAATDAAAAASAADGKAVAAQTTASNAASAASTADGKAVAAQNTANAKGKVIIQSAAPAAADRLVQNLWIDTTGGLNTPKRWTTGTTWVAVTDKAATDAAAAAALAQTRADQAFTNAGSAATIAGNAQSSANTKNTLWYLTAKPAGTNHKVNDVWFDTDNDYAISYWNGSTWALAQFGTNAIENQSITNALIKDATIHHGKIATVDAGKISTGFLNVADRVEARAIDVLKLRVGSFDNLLTDPTFVDPLTRHWVMNPTAVVAASTAVPTSNINYNTLIITTTPGANGMTTSVNRVAVSPHQKMGISFQYVTRGYPNPIGTTAPVEVGVIFETEAGTVLGTETVEIETIYDWAGVTLTFEELHNFSAVIDVPDIPKIERARFVIIQPTRLTGTPTTITRITNPMWRMATEGELIVEGSITVNQLNSSVGSDMAIYSNESIIIMGGAQDEQTASIGLINETLNGREADPANAIEAAVGLIDQINSVEGKADQGITNAKTADGKAEGAQIAAEAANKKITDHQVIFKVTSDGAEVATVSGKNAVKISPLGLEIVANGTVASTWSEGQLLVSQGIFTKMTIAPPATATNGHVFENTGTNQTTVRPI